MFGAISEKFRTLDMKINFAIPPIFHFRRWLGEFFSLFQSYEISITLSINPLRNYCAFHNSPELYNLTLNSRKQTNHTIKSGQKRLKGIVDKHSKFNNMRYSHRISIGIGS